MANNLFISYDLYAPGKDYSKVIEAIKSLGAWAKVQKSVWYVKSSINYEQAAKTVWATMDSNDSLIVIDASTNNSYWYNIDTEVSKFLQDNWKK